MSFSQTIALETYKAVLTGSAAAIVFVFGQAFLRFFIEPVVELRKTIGAVGYHLVFYAHYLHSPAIIPAEKLSEAQNECRRLAALLRSQILVIPYFDALPSCLNVPTGKQIKEASGCLIGLSNFTPETDSREHLASTRDDFVKIREALHLPNE